MNNTKLLTDIMELVDSGKLPETAIPRVCYFGHTLLHAIRQKERSYKCVTCETEWKSDVSCVCPNCNTKEKTFDITGDSQLGKWRCKKCSHEWISQDGYTCPACGTVER